MSIEAAEMSDVTYLVAMINGAYEVKHMRRALEIFEDWPDYKERVKTVFTRVSPCDLQQQQTLEQTDLEQIQALVILHFIMHIQNNLKLLKQRQCLYHIRYSIHPQRIPHWWQNEGLNDKHIYPVRISGIC